MKDLWKPASHKQLHYSQQQKQELEKLTDAVKTQLAPKPKRLAHSLSVAQEAEHLACLYDVDPFLARCAGLLHDWSKVLSKDEQMKKAQQLGIDFGVDMSLVAQLLHGKIAARELPALFPELPSEVFQAIDRHTTGAADMTPLDIVVFVADGIEPLRSASAGITALRKLVGKVSLQELFWASFAGGLAYVIQTERYLYPGTLEIYNKLVLNSHK